MKVEKMALMNSGRAGAMDVAGALAMMKDCEVGKLILLGRVNDDRESIRILTEIVSGLLYDSLKDRAQQVAAVIVREVVFPDLCSECRGRGKLKALIGIDGDNIEIDEIECKKCFGSGLEWSSSRSRARLAGIPRRTWRDLGLCEIVTAWALALEREVGHASKKFARQ